MGCKGNKPCGGAARNLQDIADFLADEAELRSGKRPESQGLEFRFGPGFLEHPITKQLTLPSNPKFRQIFLHGVRIGYVHSVKPGGKISLLRPWPGPQIEALREAILEELAVQGFDVDADRKFWAPKHEGLLTGDAEQPEEEEPSPLILT